MKKLIVIFSLFLVACGQHSSETNVALDVNDVIINDQCIARSAFVECLKSLPAGPQSTKYNDWDDVVEECRRTAFFLAKRKRSVVKPECEGH